MKKILITGSLGYIGSMLTQYLQERHYDCVGFDTGFFRDYHLYPSNDPSTIIGDMRDFQENYLNGIDAAGVYTSIGQMDGVR